MCQDVHRLLRPRHEFLASCLVRRPPLVLLLSIASVGATAADAAGGGAPPKVGGCAIFPKNNPWNQRVDKLPKASNSDSVVRAIGPGEGMHADFGSGKYDGGPIGIPYTT